MSIRVSNLRLPVEEPEAKLPTHLAHVLGVKSGEIRRWRVARKALRERFYAISLERKLKHPAVVAITQSARERLFA